MPVQCCKVPPCPIHPEQFDNTRCKHQSKQQPPYKPPRDLIMLFQPIYGHSHTFEYIPRANVNVPWSKEGSKEGNLQQKVVPAEEMNL